MYTRTRRPLVAVAALIGLMVALGTGCSDDDDASSVATTSSTLAPVSTTVPASTASPSSPTTHPVSADATVNVYWAWSIETTRSDSPEKLGAGGRPVASVAPAREAMEALLEGPDPVESEIGMTSQIPAGTELLDVAIADGIATVDLSAEFEEPGGTLGETLRLAQVVFTLTQFDTVDGVDFRVEGSDLDSFGSHGIDTGSPLSRADFESVRPFILVESPTPGAEVVGEIVLSGESNTFEASVSYTITDDDGRIVDEGFTTATAGNGEWGRFEVRVPVQPEMVGRGSVIVFETSARDGSQLDVVEYPVEFGVS